MKALVAIGACLLASTAWAQSKPQSVVVTNPSLTVQAADAGRYTHVGQRTSRFVNLYLDISGSLPIDPATGSFDSSPFVVPEGFFLIVTDIQAFGGGCAGDAVVQFTIFQRTTAGGRIALDLYETLCRAGGNALFERHYGGLMLGAGAYLTVSHGSGRAQGYLVPAS